MVNYKYEVRVTLLSGISQTSRPLNHDQCSSDLTTFSTEQLKLQGDADCPGDSNKALSRPKWKFPTRGQGLVISLRWFNA